ncbi:MAG: NAD(P)H-quinone oxidoreductase [Myxococcales bacterium]|jgi:putative PIG3 family NAD(P)H quinone oxidoreductase|nr:NAD(P)H-quinone oxidoreductase [Myxococcales bacterium]
MRAVVIREPGGPEVLELREVAEPSPSSGEVRVRVRATAVNRADLLQRMGLYPAPPGDPQDVPGLELAGEIDAVGPGVTEWRVGDRVYGLVGGGAYAEKVVVHARAIAAMPARLSFEEAAAIPEATLTAYDAMVEQAGLGAGDNVLVNAAGSGVGTAAVQIARALGAFVVGTARSQDKLDRAAALGLDRGVLPADGRFADAVRAATGGRGVDVVLELVGGNYLEEDILACAERGRVVVVGLVGGATAGVALALLLKKRLRIFGTVLRSRPLEEKIAAAQLLGRRIGPLVERGAVKPVVDAVLPLDRAGEAHRLVASNATFGKIVLSV